MTGGTEEDAAPVDATICNCHDKHTKTLAPCYLCREQTGHEQCWLCRKPERLAEEGAIAQKIKVPAWRELNALASNIVFQLGDLYELPVDLRQRTNDQAIDFVIELLKKRHTALLAEARKDELTGLLAFRSDQGSALRTIRGGLYGNGISVRQRLEQLAALGGKSDGLI